MNEKISNLIKQIGRLRYNLAKTDYQAIKFAEGELTAEEYAETREKRRAWRAEINALQAEIAEIRKEDKPS